MIRKERLKLRCLDKKFLRDGRKKERRGPVTGRGPFCVRRERIDHLSFQATGREI